MVVGWTVDVVDDGAAFVVTGAIAAGSPSATVVDTTSLDEQADKVTTTNATPAVRLIHMI